VVVILAAAFLLFAEAANAANLVFVRASTSSQQSDIYQMDDSGGAPTLLMSDGSHNEFPVWSHDGSRIAFDSNRSGRFQVYVMGSDGSNPVNVTGSSTTDKYPSWSPNDSQIAYISGSDVYKMNTDGTGKTRLTSGQFSYLFQVAWSPDGARIAFTSYDGSAYHIYTIAPDGSGLTDVTAASGIGSAESPVWSPDGTKLAFDVDNSSDRNFDIYVMNADGTGAHDITPVNGDVSKPDVSPSWSPDGSTIVFASTRNEPTNISRLFTMSSAATSYGPDVVQLTFDNPNGSQFVDQNPSYAPGGASTPPPTPSGPRYVALGDSVPAGEGINYGWTWQLDSSGVDGTWQIGDSNPSWFEQFVPQVCHQSQKAYPYLLAGLTNLQAPVNLACTGAQGQDGVLCHQSVSGVTVPPQLGTGSNPNFSCDGANGSSAYDAADPQVITLQVGADDVHFGDWVIKCYKGGKSDCGSKKDTQAVDSLLSQQRLNLSRILREIFNRAVNAGKTPPKVYVLDYYNPFPPTYVKKCHDLQPLNLVSYLSPTEMSWLEQQQVKLNQNILAEVGAFSNVTFVDIANVVQGHTFCTKSPWVYGPYIRVPASQRDNPSPFHPTPEGQLAIASKLSASINQ
jgi:Tol biopolymer transport system component